MVELVVAATPVVGVGADDAVAQPARAQAAAQSDALNLMLIFDVWRADPV
jgi:hypothetical protein